jgi:hypothetical protein
VFFFFCIFVISSYFPDFDGRGCESHHFQIRGAAQQRRHQNTARYSENCNVILFEKCVVLFLFVQLETLIRLTVAHAKCRLSRSAELQDAEASCDVMNFALYNEVRSEMQAPALPGNRPVPVGGQEQQQERVGEKRQADRGEEEENIGDKRERSDDEIVEREEDRAKRCRKLFKKCLSDRKLENCEMQELLRVRLLFVKRFGNLNIF